MPPTPKLPPGIDGIEGGGWMSGVGGFGGGSFLRP